MDKNLTDPDWVWNAFNGKRNSQVLKMVGGFQAKWGESPFQVEEIIWAKLRNHTECMGNYKCHCIAGVQGQEWQAMRLKTLAEPPVMKGLLCQVQEPGFHPGIRKPVSNLNVTWAGHSSLTGQMHMFLDLTLFKENSLISIHIVYKK